ncbi:hypothetical protein NS226_08255 [Aureimonas ureilytica]|uniref:Uncharacterized protein n=1 Tax=Aureimonas ureilytica TaxID=401562 RepID=A0A175RC20_9HYPH|nr:hypothetical protein NS226_08255 [Aureimonas ureilytica]
MRDASPDIARLGSETHIVFGKAEIRAGANYYFVDTVKRFGGPNGRLKISIRVPNDASSAEGLGQLVGVTATAFWHGPVPTLDRTQTSFFTVAPDQTVYSGLIVKAGEYQP